MLDFEDAARLLGARLEAGQIGEPTILCASLGMDEQGRHLQRVLEAAKTVGAWLVLVEGPRAVAWDLGERRCQQRGWGSSIVEFVTTELGEAMARRRRCLVARPGGELPEGLARRIGACWGSGPSWNNFEAETLGGSDLAQANEVGVGVRNSPGPYAAVPSRPLFLGR